MEGTQEGQTSYLSGDVPVECVRLMPACLTAARCPKTVCTGAQQEPVRTLVRSRTKFFLKNELFFRDPEDVYSRSARPSAS